MSDDRYVDKLTNAVADIARAVPTGVIKLRGEVATDRACLLIGGRSGLVL